MARAAVEPGNANGGEAQGLEDFTNTVPHRGGGCQGKIHHAKSNV